MRTFFKAALILGLCLSGTLAKQKRRPSRRHQIESYTEPESSEPEEIYANDGQGSLHVPEDTPEGRSFSITAANLTDDRAKTWTTITTDKPLTEADSSLTTLLSQLIRLIAHLPNLLNSTRNSNSQANDAVSPATAVQPQVSYYAVPTLYAHDGYRIGAAQLPANDGGLSMWMRLYSLQANADLVRATTFTSTAGLPHQTNAGMPVLADNTLQALTMATVLQGTAALPAVYYGTPPYYREFYPSTFYSPNLFPQAGVYPGGVQTSGDTTITTTKPTTSTTPAPTGRFSWFPFANRQPQQSLPASSISGAHWRLVRDTSSSFSNNNAKDGVLPWTGRRAGQAMLTENTNLPFDGMIEKKEDANDSNSKEE